MMISPLARYRASRAGCCLDLAATSITFRNPFRHRRIQSRHRLSRQVALRRLSLAHCRGANSAFRCKCAVGIAGSAGPLPRSRADRSVSAQFPVSPTKQVVGRLTPRNSGRLALPRSSEITLDAVLWRDGCRIISPLSSLRSFEVVPRRHLTQGPRCQLRRRECRVSRTTMQNLWSQREKYPYTYRDALGFR